MCPHQGCEKSFVRAVHLKRHLLSHDGEKIFKSVALPYTIYNFATVYLQENPGFLDCFFSEWLFSSDEC